MNYQIKKLEEFELEKHFAKYEDKIKYYMCCSDAETMSLNEILNFLKYFKKTNNELIFILETPNEPELTKEILYLLNIE